MCTIFLVCVTVYDSKYNYTIISSVLRPWWGDLAKKHDSQILMSRFWFTLRTVASVALVSMYRIIILGREHLVIFYYEINFNWIFSISCILILYYWRSSVYIQTRTGEGTTVYRNSQERRGQTEIRKKKTHTVSIVLNNKRIKHFGWKCMLWM